MNKIVTLVVLGLMLAFAGQALPQQGTMRGGGGWGPGMPYARMYNSVTVETISGVVLSVEKIPPMKGMSYGVRLMVKTEKETISVHLGPAWYIENQDPRIAPKDILQVKGSRIMFEGKPALIAAEIKKGDEVLTLRDGSGFPVWSGWRRR